MFLVIVEVRSLVVTVDLSKAETRRQAIFNIWWIDSTQIERGMMQYLVI